MFIFPVPLTKYLSLYFVLIFFRTNITFTLLILYLYSCSTLDYASTVICKTPPESVSDSGSLGLDLWSK